MSKVPLGIQFLRVLAITVAVSALAGYVFLRSRGAASKKGSPGQGSEKQWASSTKSQTLGSVYAAAKEAAAGADETISLPQLLEEQAEGRAGVHEEPEDEWVIAGTKSAPLITPAMMTAFLSPDNQGTVDDEKPFQFIFEAPAQESLKLRYDPPALQTTDSPR